MYKLQLQVGKKWLAVVRLVAVITLKNYSKLYLLKDCLLERYEGGLATLQFDREWQWKIKASEESLHPDLRLKYEQTFPGSTSSQTKLATIDEMSKENAGHLVELLQYEKE
jgi:hypothetical protein